MSQDPQFPWQSQVAERSLEDMRDVLANPQSAGSAIQYYMIRGGNERGNITTWSAGTNGGEYIKAFGHYHIQPFIETYTVLEGEGYMIIQDPKPSTDSPTHICLIKLIKGDAIRVPALWGHAMINTGKTWLITIDDSPVSGFGNTEASAPSHADYEAVRQYRGFGYYLFNTERTEALENTSTHTVIDEHIVAIPNPTYTTLPSLEVFKSIETFNTHAEKTGWIQ